MLVNFYEFLFFNGLFVKKWPATPAADIAMMCCNDVVQCGAMMWCTDLGGWFLRYLIGRGLCDGPHIVTIKNPNAVQPRFSPISSPVWVLVGVRVRVRVRC